MNLYSLNPAWYIPTVTFWDISIWKLLHYRACPNATSTYPPNLTTVLFCFIKYFVTLSYLSIQFLFSDVGNIRSVYSSILVYSWRRQRSLCFFDVEQRNVTKKKVKCKYQNKNRTKRSKSKLKLTDWQTSVTPCDSKLRRDFAQITTPQHFQFGALIWILICMQHYEWKTMVERWNSNVRLKVDKPPVTFLKPKTEF